MKKIAIVTAFLFFFLMARTVQSATINVTSCGTYSTDDSLYLLQNDIVDVDGGANYGCIILSADNSVFDCQNHLLDGVNYLNPPSQQGIRLTGDYNTIKNCRLTDWLGSGIRVWFPYPSHWIIENVTAGVKVGAGNYGAHFTLAGSASDAYGIVRNCTIENTLFPYFAIQSTSRNMTIEDTIIRNNNYHAVKSDGDNTTIRGTIFENNGGGAGDTQITINGDSGLIYNNFINHSDSADYLHYTGSDLRLNVTLQSGTNIVGGNLTGGNFWTNPSGTGFSNTCVDADQNGICDTNYTVDGVTDYLPLSDEYIPPPPPPPPVPPVPCVILECQEIVAGKKWYVYANIILCKVANWLLCFPYFLAFIIAVGVLYAHIKEWIPEVWTR